jgi:hypothetical protein
MRSKRYLEWLIAALVMLAVASCGSKGSSGSCPDGQARQGTGCVTQQACTDPATCNANAVPCGPGGTCDGTNVCVAGKCVAANAACTFHPEKGPFTPRIAWQWTGSANQPQYDQVLMTPVVVPLQRDLPDAFQPPAVVFNSMLGTLGAGSEVPGVVRAVSGRDGGELWTSDPAHLVNGLAGMAAGDLRGDGTTVFVTARNGTVWPPTDPNHTGPPSDDGLIAFDNKGHFLWEVPGLHVFWGAPSIANLYGRADSQVVLGSTIIDANGKVVCSGTAGIGENFLGPISTVADVDLDGVPDIVTGNTIYDNHCQPKPGWPNGQPDGLVAVANFTGDAHPQIAVVANGTVRIQDFQGKVIWGPIALPNGSALKGGGGPPTIADFDGDGKLEIGVAGFFTYTVFKPFAANPVLWSKPTQDTSGVTGSSVFDFEHDGKAEVVYGDECYTRVFDGTSGATLFEAQNPSCTVHENPVIADVDKDGRAEMVVATNSVCNIICHAPDGTTWTHAGLDHHGVTVYKDLRDHWVSTRPIWNQHAYHVTNVNDDGTIPNPEPRNWEAPGLNNFRMNVIGDEDFRAPDLVAQASDVSLDSSSCPAQLTVKVNVWNRGAVLVAAGIPVAVYQGAAGGKLLAVGQTKGAIVPGAFEAVTIAVTPGPTTATDLAIVVNDDGTGQGLVGECDRTNNAQRIAGVFCPAQGG